MVIDRGAQRALLSRGKSLLPSGIKEVKGTFRLGDSVILTNEKDEELAVGMVNYNSGEVRKIMGSRSSEIESILGFRHDDEVIHRDNLVITRENEEGENVCQLRA
jgi:glutamate 5-kinase